MMLVRFFKLFNNFFIIIIKIIDCLATVTHKVHMRLNINDAQALAFLAQDTQLRTIKAKDVEQQKYASRARAHRYVPCPLGR